MDNSAAISGEGLPGQLLTYYELNPCSVKRRGNYWLIDSGKGKYLVAEYHGKTDLLSVVLDWQNHLYTNGCGQVLQIMKAKNGKEYIELEDRVFYIALCPQTLLSLETGIFQGQQVAHLLAAVTALAKFHGYSNGYLPDAAREINIFWPGIIQDRLTELIVCKQVMNKNKFKTDFERIFLESFDFLYDQGQESLQNMILAGYGSKPELQKSMLINSFLAGDIFVDNDEVIFLNLSKWETGPAVMDLSLFLNSYMPQHRWKKELLCELIEQFTKYKELTGEERHFLLAQLRFPSRYWLYAYQYCNVQEDVREFAEKLKFYRQECYWRDLCLDSIEGWL